MNPAYRVLTVRELLEQIADHNVADPLEFIKHHRNDGVKRLLKNRRMCLDDAVARSAGTFGNLEILQMFPELSLSNAQIVVQEAVINGHITIMEWIYANYKTHDDQYRQSIFTGQTMFKAATHGHLHIIQWLHKTFPYSIETCGDIFYAAAFNRHLDVLEWICRSIDAFWTWPGILAIISNDDLDALKLVYSIRPVSGSYKERIDHAIKCGSVKILEYLYSKADIYEMKRSIWRDLEAAATRGHLGVIKFLCRNNPNVCVGDVARNAIFAGHLVVAKWLSENYNKECHECTIRFDAMSDKLSGVVLLDE